MDETSIKSGWIMDKIWIKGHGQHLWILLFTLRHQNNLSDDVLKIATVNVSFFDSFNKHVLILIWI